MTNENTENHSIPVRLTDILHFKSLSNLSLSLDGTRAAFMIHQCNGAQDGYNSNLWIYDLSRGRTVQVTSGNKKQIFCWTPDGSLVYATPDAETHFTKVNPEGKNLCGSGGTSCPFQRCGIHLRQPQQPVFV